MITGYRNAKTSHKLITAFVLMALIAGGVGALGLTEVKMLNAFINDLYNDSLLMSIDLGHVGKEAAEVRMSALKMTSGLYDDRLQQIFDEANASTKNAEKLIEKYAADLHGSEVKPYEEMKDAWKAYNESRTRTMTLALAGETEKARENARGDAGNKYALFDEKLEALIDVQDKDGREVFDRSVKAEKTATMTIIVAVILSMLAAVGAGLFISSLIAVPLKEMADAAQKISKGDLDVNMEAKTTDEVGILAGAFKEMIGYLRGIAEVAEEIAAGDLRSEVTPNSGKDVLGNAFKKMIEGLREHNRRDPGGRGPDRLGFGPDRVYGRAVGAEQRSRGHGRGGDDVHDARDVGEYPERGEEHAEPGILGHGDLGLHRADGGVDPANREHRAAAHDRSRSRRRQAVGNGLDAVGQIASRGRMRSTGPSPGRRTRSRRSARGPRTSARSWM